MLARPRSSAVLRSVLLTLLCFCFSSLLPTRAEACSCGPATESVWENYTVFHGRSLEVRFDGTGLDMAVRYVVENSNRLKPGDEAIVFRATSSAACGGGTDAVGTSGVVVAENSDGVLHTSLCARISTHERPAVLKKLGLPHDFFEQKTKRWQTSTPRPQPTGCKQPDTVVAAFSRSHAVIKPSLNNSCWNEERQMVETAATAHVSFKGAPDDEWFLLFHPPDDAGGRGPMHRPVYEAVRVTWPPALFLRSEGNASGKIYVHDRCLDPVFPADSGEQAIADIRKHLRYPAGWSHHDPKNDKPALSCSTMDDAFVNKGLATLAAFQQRSREEHRRAKSETDADPRGTEPSVPSPREESHPPQAERSSPTPAAPPERPRSGCAGCSVPAVTGTSHGTLLSLLLLIVAVRRRTCAQYAALHRDDGRSLPA